MKILPRAMALTAPAFVLVAACAKDGAKYEETTVEVAASESAPLGRWYGGDGIEDLRVSTSQAGYSVRMRLPAGDQYRLVDARVIEGLLNLWVSGPEETIQSRLQEADPGRWNLVTIEGHGYLMVHEATAEWRAARRAERAAGRALSEAEGFLDWLVRVL